MLFGRASCVAMTHLLARPVGRGRASRRRRAAAHFAQSTPSGDRSAGRLARTHAKVGVVGVDRAVLFRLATNERLERTVKAMPGGNARAWRAASRYVAGRSRIVRHPQMVQHEVKWNCTPFA